MSLLLLSSADMSCNASTTARDSSCRTGCSNAAAVADGSTGQDSTAAAMVVVALVQHTSVPSTSVVPLLAEELSDCAELFAVGDGGESAGNMCSSNIVSPRHRVIVLRSEQEAGSTMANSSNVFAAGTIRCAGNTGADLLACCSGWLSSAALLLMCVAAFLYCLITLPSRLFCKSRAASLYWMFASWTAAGNPSAVGRLLWLLRQAYCQSGCCSLVLLCCSSEFSAF